MKNKKDRGFICFAYADKYFLFDYYLFVTIEITKNFYEFLLANDTRTDNINSKENILLSKLIDSGLLYHEHRQDIIEQQKNDSIAYLSFAPIYECNLRCKYCFGDSGAQYKGTPRHFDYELVKKTIKYFVFNLFPNASKYRIDFVSGGEPLLNFDSIKIAVELCEQLQTQTGKAFDLWICTNGTLLDEETCVYLDHHKVSIGISLDGDQAHNDYNRIDLNGKGTYSRVVNRIKSIESSKILSSNFKRIWGLSVITEDNHDLVSILKHHYTLGFSSVQMKIARQKRTEEEAISFYNKLKNSIFELGNFLFEEFQKGNDSYLLMILNSNDMFGKFLRRIILQQYVTKRCLAGCSKVTICPDGVIYPCDSFVGINNKAIGSINNERFDNSEFLNASISTSSECELCDYNLFCGGDCYYNAYINNGDIKKPELLACELSKELCISAIVLWHKMNVFDKVRSARIYKILCAKELYQH